MSGSKDQDREEMIDRERERRSSIKIPRILSSIYAESVTITIIKEILDKESYEATMTITKRNRGMMFS